LYLLLLDEAYVWNDRIALPEVLRKGVNPEYSPVMNAIPFTSGRLSDPDPELGVSSTLMLNWVAELRDICILLSNSVAPMFQLIIPTGL